MANESNDKKNDSVYSQRVRAGKRRTYFFDVRETRGSDYYLTITESRKKFNEDGYDRHKIFLYKEDFNKFLKGITEAIDYVKTELMPDFDFDVFSHEHDDQRQDYKPDPTETIAGGDASAAQDDSGDQKTDETPTQDTSDQNDAHKDEQVDKW